MKNLVLKNYSTSELNFDEQRETDGGNPLWIVYGASLVAYFLMESAANPAASVKNLENGYNAGRH